MILTSNSYITLNLICTGHLVDKKGERFGKQTSRDLEGPEGFFLRLVFLYLKLLGSQSYKNLTLNKLNTEYKLKGNSVDLIKLFANKRKPCGSLPKVLAADAVTLDPVRALILSLKRERSVKKK